MTSTFGDELHLWRGEGIVGSDDDINVEDAIRVRSVVRSFYRARQMLWIRHIHLHSNTTKIGMR